MDKAENREEKTGRRVTRAMIFEMDPQSALSLLKPQPTILSESRTSVSLMQ